MENLKSIAVTGVKKLVDVCANVPLIQENFAKGVKGYHMINTSPINETVWEDINSLVFSSVGIEVYSKSDGSHLSGMDIDCALGKISNKSAKYKYTKAGKCIDISSYRLTTVCSDKHCGTPSDIIQEIKKRENFDYYSFMVRDETEKDTIQYDWMLIPSHCAELDPELYAWEPSFSKKNPESQVGWKTNKINGSHMSISFSMSSQLWMHIEMTEEIKKYIIASTVTSNKASCNYIQLVDKLN